jgi:hypothetical protein
MTVGAAIERSHTLMQMETPSSGVGIFELPCGYLEEDTGELLTTVVLREITGAEEDMLASRKIPNEQKVLQLLKGCIQRLGDVEDRGKLNLMIGDLLQGDQVFLMFALRRVTLGDELPVRETCPKCGDESLFLVNLAEELKIQPMADPKRRVFDCELPSGKTARFRVATITDGLKRSKALKRLSDMDTLSQAMLMRLELLEGEQPTLEMVKSLGMKDRQFLRAEFERVEGGVDTTLEYDCPGCSHHWKKDLDLKASSFFSPGDQQKP